MDAELKTQTERNNPPKLKFFMIYKIVISVLYFIPSLLISEIAIGLGFILLFIAVGASKSQDVHGFVSSIGYFSIFSIIPAILSVILIVLSVKNFKNKYNKKFDLIVCFLELIVSILYFILLMYMPIIPLAILVAVLMIPIIVNIIMIIKE